MIALKTSLNGKHICMAGENDLGVLNAIVNAVGKLGPQSQTVRDPDEPPALFLTVGGLTARSDSHDEHLRWVEQQQLSIGDEIVITVIEASDCDEATDNWDEEMLDLTTPDDHIYVPLMKTLQVSKFNACCLDLTRNAGRR